MDVTTQRDHAARMYPQILKVIGQLGVVARQYSAYLDGRTDIDAAQQAIITADESVHGLRTALIPTPIPAAALGNPWFTPAQTSSDTTPGLRSRS